jgi:hypothetical protein
MGGALLGGSDILAVSFEIEAISFLEGSGLDCTSSSSSDSPNSYFF